MVTFMKKGKILVVGLLSVGVVFGGSCSSCKENSSDDELDRYERRRDERRRRYDEEERKRRRDYDEWEAKLEMERKKNEEDRKKREQEMKERIKKEVDELCKQQDEFERKRKDELKENKENDELSKKFNDLRKKAAEIFREILLIRLELEDQFGFKEVSKSYEVDDIYNAKEFDGLKSIYDSLSKEKESLTAKLNEFKADRAKNMEVMEKVNEAFRYLRTVVYSDSFCDHGECKLNTEDYKNKVYRPMASSLKEAQDLLAEINAEQTRVENLIEAAKRKKEKEEVEKLQKERKKKEEEAKKKKKLEDLTKEGKELIRSIIEDMVSNGGYRCYYYKDCPDVIRDVKFFGVGGPYESNVARFLLNVDGNHNIFADHLSSVCIYGGIKYYSTNFDECLKKYNINRPDYSTVVADVKEKYDKYFKKPRNSKFSDDAFVLVSGSDLFDPYNNTTYYIKCSHSVCDPDKDIAHVLGMVSSEYRHYLYMLINGTGILCNDFNSMFENSWPYLIIDSYCSKLGNSSGAAPLPVVNNNLPSCVTQFINHGGQQYKNLIVSFINKSVKLKALLRKVNAIK